MLTVKHAQLNFHANGTPFSTQYSDQYFSHAGAIAECRHVFIQGNRLTQRWQQAHISIGELGFGCGINFLTTCSDWLQQARPNQRLHYISFEKHPVHPDQLKTLYARLALDHSLTEQLLKQYPLALQGFHRLHLANRKITLTLVFGDALSQLKQCDMCVDAWYLDGFSPSKNPDLWSQDIAQQIYRLTQPGGTFATYSVAAAVKQHFASAGFTLHKQAGYAAKKHMLTGQSNKTQAATQFHYQDKSWFKQASSQVEAKKAIIIGAGLAGFCIAHALAQRDWQCIIVDQQPAPAMAGSGNLNAILMPRLSVDHDVQSQLTLQGFLYSQQLFSELDAQNTFWHPCGAIQIARDATQAERMRQIVSREDIPDQLIQVIDQHQASALSQCQIESAGWYIPLAGWIVPKQLCLALQVCYPQQIEFIAGQHVRALHAQPEGWQVATQHATIATGSHVILANANGVSEFAQAEWCQLHAKRGQLTYLPTALSPIHPQKIICSDVYLTPEVEQHYVVGASFISADQSIDIRTQEHIDNLTRLQKIIADVDPSLDQLGGRAAIRAVGPDRLPILGPVADQQKFQQTFLAAAQGNTRVQYPLPTYHQGLYVASGFGSRGLAWIPLCAEALACMLNNEPSPLSGTVQQALHPSRLLMEQLLSQANA